MCDLFSESFEFESEYGLKIDPEMNVTTLLKDNCTNQISSPEDKEYINYPNLGFCFVDCGEADSTKLLSEGYSPKMENDLPDTSNCIVEDIKPSYAVRISGEDTKHRLNGVNETSLVRVKIYCCQVCNYKTSDIHSMKRHLRVHTGDKPYSCQLCDYKSRQSYALKLHTRTHTNDRPYSCSECGYRASKASHLKAHVMRHKGEKPHCCELCPFKSSQARNLRIHMRSHTGQKPFACTFCDFTSAHSQSLKRHMRTHLPCGVCSFVAIDSWSLLEHMKTLHKMFARLACDYMSDKPSSLRQQTLLHASAKHYSCSVCGQTSLGRKLFKKHLTSHTDSMQNQAVYSNKNIKKQSKTDGISGQLNVTLTGKEENL